MFKCVKVRTKRILILIILLLFTVITSLHADTRFVFYPGIYLGSNAAVDEDISVGFDLQTGIEFSTYVLFGLYGNIGIDSGVPNQPNLYYGGVMEILFGQGYFKCGPSIGAGLNNFIENSISNYKSIYWTFGFPIRFTRFFKVTPCFDYYPGIGGRFGWLIHSGIISISFF